MCLKWFQQECTNGLSYGTQSVAGALFWQFYGDSVLEREMEMVSSCFRSGWMFRMCLTSLSKLRFAAMRVGVCYASFFTLKQENVKLCF